MTRLSKTCCNCTEAQDRLEPRRAGRLPALCLSVARPIASGLGAQRPPVDHLRNSVTFRNFVQGDNPQSISRFIGRCRSARDPSPGKIRLCIRRPAHALKFGRGDADHPSRRPRMNASRY
jgi:hypothetical protein